MSIAGASATLAALLTAELSADGGLSGFSVGIMGPRDVRADLANRIGLILYRVEVDPVRRRHELPRATPFAPRRDALGLELRYLLTVWGQASAEGEQVMLSRCMDAFDRNPVIAGPALAPGYPWEPGDALKISPDSLPTDELLRLWDTIDAPYQLTIPYLVRTVRLPAQQRPEAPMVDVRTLVAVPEVPQ